LTEAAEVLLDHGQTNVYSWTKEQAQQQLHHLDKQQHQQQPASNAPKSVSRSCCYDEQTVCVHSAAKHAGCVLQGLKPIIVQHCF